MNHSILITIILMIILRICSLYPIFFLLQDGCSHVFLGFFCLPAQCCRVAFCTLSLHGAAACSQSQACQFQTAAEAFQALQAQVLPRLNPALCILCRVSRTQSPKLLVPLEQSMSQHASFDVVIIGSGFTGLGVAAVFNKKE